MSQRSSAYQYTGGPGTLLHPGNTTASDALIESYTPLLGRIAGAFGFTESEVHDLLEQVQVYARTHRAADCYPFRIWLAKIMVHTCTFRIGNRLFGQCGCPAPERKETCSDGYYASGKARSLRLEEMPLSFRAVYILTRDIGFSKSEIALILNTTPAQVVERYTNALAFLAG